MTRKEQQRAESQALLAQTTVRVTKCPEHVRTNYHMGRKPGSGPVPAYVYDDGQHHSNRAVAIIH